MRAYVVLLGSLLLVSAASGQVFRAPVKKLPAPINGTPATDYAPTLPADMLTIYWTSQRAGGKGFRDVWMATRTALNQPWSSSATNVAVVSTTASEDYIDVSGDGKKLYVSATKRTPNLGQSDIWVHTWTGSGWDAGTLLPAPVNSSSFEDDPSITDDGLELYFTSGRQGGANIFVAKRATASTPWSKATVTKLSINSTSFDHSPAISGDGLTLIFSSTRSGGGGGSSDHWITTRPDRNSPWSTPVPLKEINTRNWDHNGQLTSDGFSFYFAFQNAIYRADRILCVVYPENGVPPKIGQLFKIYVRRDTADSGQPGVIVGSLGKLPAPVPLPGFKGALQVSLAPGMVFWLAIGALNAEGKFTTALPVPNAGVLVGLKTYWQGASRDAGLTWYLSPLHTATVTK